MTFVRAEDCENTGPDMGALALPETGLAGVEPFFHEDKTGKWGGHRAVVGHFNKPNDDTADDNAFLYILVGSYDRVGTWRGCETGLPSKWEVAKLLADELQNGTNTATLYAAIQQAIHGSRDAASIAASELLTHTWNGEPCVRIEPLMWHVGCLATASVNDDRRPMRLALLDIGSIVLRWLAKLVEVPSSDAAAAE